VVADGGADGRHGCWAGHRPWCAWLVPGGVGGDDGRDDASVARFDGRAVCADDREQDWARPLLFAGAYLLVWGAGGLLSYGQFRLGKSVLGGDLAWHPGGRLVAGEVLAVAALYELTPLKHVCLAKCRSLLGFLLGTWRDGRLGALELDGPLSGHRLGAVPMDFDVLV
jgi:Predicted metal-binding integral membrane protein (DUF2182)